MIYFDNAATSYPKPKEVYRAAERCMRGAYGNAGRGGSAAALAAQERIYSVREAVCALLSFNKPENVIFTHNCTQALNIALFGLLSPGSHVLVSRFDHNAVLRPVYEMAKHGVSFDFYGGADSRVDELAAEIEAKIRPETTLITIPTASNVTGRIFPYVRIAELARRRGLVTVLDASQIAGRRKFAASMADIICFSGHKELFGIQGVGVLVMSGGVLPRPLIFGGTGSASEAHDMPEFSPDRYEAGTQSLPAIASLGAGITYIMCESLGYMRERNEYLFRELYWALADIPEVSIYSPCKCNCGIVLFDVPSLDTARIAERLRVSGIAVRYGLHCAPAAHEAIGTLERGGAIRASVGVFNNKPQILRFASAVKRAIREQRGASVHP